MLHITFVGCAAGPQAVLFPCIYAVPFAVAQVHVPSVSSRGQCSLADDYVRTEGRGEKSFFSPYFPQTFYPESHPLTRPLVLGQAVKQAARDASQARRGKGGESRGCWALVLLGSTTCGLPHPWPAPPVACPLSPIGPEPLVGAGSLDL